MKARMATKIGLLNNLNRSTCFAGLGFALSCGTLQAQENVFRVASAQIPTANPLPGSGQGSDKKVDEENVSNSQENVIRFKPEQSQTSDAPVGQTTDSQAEKTSLSTVREQTKAKNREPLVLPALPTPNTSIEGVGTGSTPEDFVSGRLPPSRWLPYGPDRYGTWALETKTWIAPVFCHQPVYFEDTMLERHGQERVPCIQPIISGAKFFTDLAILPYKSYLQRPLEERYNTGHYRPGSAAPGLRQRVPYDAGAIRLQLLTTGTAVLAGQP